MPCELCSRARETCRQGCQVRANGAVHASHNREREMRSAWWNIKTWASRAVRSTLRAGVAGSPKPKTFLFQELHNDHNFYFAYSV